MRVLDFLRPQPPLASLLASPSSKRSVPAAGPVAKKLMSSVRAWVPPRREVYELLVSYGQLPWLHAVVRRRAEALAQVEWILWRAKTLGARRALRALQRITPGPGAAKEIAAKSRRAAALLDKGEAEMVTEHPLLALLSRPWPGAGSDVALWELASKHQDLAGENLFALERGRDKKPVELLPIVPSWVTEVPSADRPYFEVRPPRGAPMFTLSVADAIWIRQHDPADPFLGRGIGTAAALTDELETDEYMAATAKARFFNRAMPEVIVGLIGGEGTPPPGASEIENIAEDLENKHRGVERAGQMHLVPGDIRVAELGATFAANQHVEGREFLRNACMQIFGVPPEVLGVLDNANRSTIDAAAVHFATYSTLPMLMRFCGALQLMLVPEFGDDLVLDFVSPIPADKEFEKGLMVALPGAFTKNEIRELAGKGPRPDGDVLYPAATGNAPTPGEKATAPDAAAKEKANAGNP